MGVSFSIRRVPIPAEPFDVGARSSFYEIAYAAFHYRRWPLVLTADDIRTLRACHEKWVAGDHGGKPFLDLVKILDSDTDECDIILEACR